MFEIWAKGRTCHIPRDIPSINKEEETTKNLGNN